jgi:hypothetical protein
VSKSAHVIDDESVYLALDRTFCSVGLETRTHKTARDFIDARRVDLPDASSWTCDCPTQTDSTCRRSLPISAGSFAAACERNGRYSAEGKGIR